MSDAPAADSVPRVCENCDDAPVTLYCADCKMEFCDRCDADFHKPAKKAAHVRKARFPTAVADILRKCEKEGKVSDYGTSKPEGKNILKYVLEYEEGYWYLWKNNSTDLHLDAELEFKMNNLVIVGFESASKVKVGKLPSVYVPVTYDADNTPLEVLQAQTEKEGLCTDHGSQDPAGLVIHQYQWEYSQGYCFLWINSSKDVHFHKELELDLKNLQIKGAEPEQRKYVVDIKPGERAFMILKEVEPKQAYGVSMRAGFSLQKIKA